MLVFVLLVITAILVLGIGYIHKDMLQSCGYLLAMFLCAMSIDFIASRKSHAGNYIVRNPVKESVGIAISLLIGIICLAIRFVGPWESISGLPRIIVGVSMMIFAFPVVIAAILLLFRYKPRELGIRLQGFWSVLPVIAIVVITARVVAPDSMTLDHLMSTEGGVVMVVLSGLMLAGLPEEFLKMAGQTRFGALLRNKGAGWLIITIIWAVMHMPKFYSDGHNVKEAVIGAVRIMPIGLMWGYLSHRTKSILPAILVHGTNIWGLQNF